MRNTGLSLPTFMVVCKITALCCGYAYYGVGVIYGQVTRLQNQAGAQHSQSPMKAEGRAVMGLSYLWRLVCKECGAVGLVNIVPNWHDARGHVVPFSLGWKS